VNSSIHDLEPAARRTLLRLLRPPLSVLQLESLPVLQGMLAAFQQWEAGLRAALQDPSGAPLKPSFATLQAASLAAKAWPITSPLRAFVDTAVAKTGAQRTAARTGLRLWKRARTCSSPHSYLPCSPSFIRAPSPHCPCRGLE
jgi:hypothetical protein